MSLPTYKQVHDALPPGLRGVVIPMKRPTRVGLGHFVAKSWREGNGATWLAHPPEWKMIWLSDIYAYRFMLEMFYVRLPAHTFRHDAARVRFLLRYPDTRRNDLDAQRANRWAHS
jgi:hypothetical protein